MALRGHAYFFLHCYQFLFCKTIARRSEWGKPELKFLILVLKNDKEQSYSTNNVFSMRI